MNRLARELAGLRIRQQQQTPQPSGSQTQSQSQSHLQTANGFVTSFAEISAASTNGSTTLMSGVYPDPSPSIILDALKKENETLRSRLADMDREQGHLKRVNEIYREELIEHRARVSFSFLSSPALPTDENIFLLLLLLYCHVSGYYSAAWTAC